MFELNYLLFAVIVVSLALVGFMAWAAENDSFDKYRRYFGWAIFAMLLVFGGALYSIYDDSDFEYEEWDIAKKGKKKKDQQQGGGGGGGGGPGQKKGAAGGGGEEQGNNAEDENGAGAKETAEGGEDDDKKLKTVTDCKVCPEMVRVPSGVALLGSPMEIYSGNAQSGPPAQVTIQRSYLIGRYEIKVREFQTFIKETGYSPSGACDVAGRLKPGANYLRPGFRQSKDGPAVCVSWLDAQAYVSWLSKKAGRKYRLPTEIEWEYAARAGITGPFSWDEMASFKHANFNDVAGMSAGGTTRAGTYPANGYGLSDVHGNAWELVENCWARGYQVASANRDFATQDCGRRMMKGGGWRSPADQMRFSMRSPVRSDFASDTVGFRVVRD